MYICRERERLQCTYVYVYVYAYAYTMYTYDYIYIYIYIYMHVLVELGTTQRTPHPHLQDSYQTTHNSHECKHNKSRTHTYKCVV